MTTTAPSSPSASPPSPDRASRRPGEAPPEWAVERLVKGIGRAPAAVGTFLDRQAKMPVIGPVVRLFSSVVFGLVILGLIGLYIAIGSGFANLRASFEMTDLEFFDAWPMRILLLLLVLDLSIVTLRRIPLTLFKLGSWTVHTGILTLIAGSVWYFSCKEEGSVRIYLGKTVNASYDVTARALYAFKADGKGGYDTEHAAITPLPGLPIYYEHLAQNGNPLDRQVPKALSTLDPALKDYRVKITGYYPAAILQRSGWRPATAGEKAEGGPGIAFQLSSDRDSLPEGWLVGSTPSDRLLESESLPLSIEFLYHPGAERIRDLQASFDGPMGMTVRVPSAKVERTYAVKPNEVIAVEGTPYTIQATDLQQMPMLSKGYENTRSSVLVVKVKRAEAGGGAFEFERNAVFRYPERSPDFVMEDGKKVRKQGGVDPAIQIVFHDASKPQVWLVEDEDGSVKLIVRDVTGKSTTQALKLDDKPAALGLATIPTLKLKLTGRSEGMVAEEEPMIVPNEQRPRGQTTMEVMQLSMVEVEVSRQSGSGAGTWRQKAYVPFSPYAAIGDPPVGEHPAVLHLPEGDVGLLLATEKRPLPSSLTLTKFEPVHYAGATRAYADYVSTLTAKSGDGSEKTLVSRLNAPAVDEGWYYFQAAWDGKDDAPPEKRFTVIGVANRPGIDVMTAGAILIIVGIGYAFYVKPILLKKKKASLAAWAAAT